MKYSAKIRMSFMLLLLVSGCVNAQDTRFSQPLNNVLVLNPAMMELTSDLRLGLTYRNQWATINNGYVTYSGSLLCPLFLGTKGTDSSGKDYSKQRLDFGLNITDDKSGGFNRIAATFSIAYSLKLNAANSITAGLNLGFLQYNFGTMNQSFDEQYQFGTYNSTLPNGESLLGNKANVDVGLGFMWHYAPLNNKIQAFAGLSAFHVNEPNLSINNGEGKLPARFNFQGGVKIIGNKLDFTPVVMYDFQGPFNQFIGGLLAAYKLGKNDNKAKLIVGTWYKQSDAVVLQAGFEYKVVSFTYSYDFGISQLARTTTGLMTHEINLTFQLYDIAKKKGIAARSFL